MGSPGHLGPRTGGCIGCATGAGPGTAAEAKRHGGVGGRVAADFAEVVAAAIVCALANHSRPGPVAFATPRSLSPASQPGGSQEALR